MLEKFSYTNSFNEKLEFGKDCLFVNENDLRDFTWEIASKNNKISGFKKGIVSKTIPVILKCDSESDGVQLRNTLFEIFEKDILAKQYGKIQIGDYYLRCYITGSKKTQYLINMNYMLLSLTVETDLPQWVKETTTTHELQGAISDVSFDFPYDYPYGFKSEISGSTLNNTNFVESNFIMTVMGDVISPTVYIGDHKYSVNVAVGMFEYLTINSIEKTIVLTKADGKQVNCFNDRSKDSYIFKKIPVGVSTITSSNNKIQFKLTLLEERSEPKWI